MSGRVEGKVAFITGAARGQGRSHAMRLAQEGADIICIDLCEEVPTAQYVGATENDLKETVRQVEALGRKIVSSKADVRDAAAVKAALDQGVAELGHLDIVVANAGIGSYAPAEELTPQQWSEMIGINLTGVWHTAQASIPHLRRNGKGSMIYTSSAAGLKGIPNLAHYVSAKHGVVGLMRSLAKELGPDWIRVNSVHPTGVNTDMLLNDAVRKLFRPDLDAPTDEDMTVPSIEMHMLPIPWIEPIDISNAILFLASDESRYVTSVALAVDAGNTQK
jgi:(+)-trans-carveol dehydrogenase